MKPPAHAHTRRGQPGRERELLSRRRFLTVVGPAGVVLDASQFPFARARTAYWEHMPLRTDARPSGNAIQIFRRAEYGNLASFHANGTYALPETLRVDIAPRHVDGPVSNATVAIGFTQHMAPTDAPRTASTRRR